MAVSTGSFQLRRILTIALPGGMDASRPLVGRAEGGTVVTATRGARVSNAVALFTRESSRITTFIYVFEEWYGV